MCIRDVFQIHPLGTIQNYLYLRALMDAKPFKIDFFAKAFECVTIRCNTVRNVFRFRGNSQIFKTIIKVIG